MMRQEFCRMHCRSCSYAVNKKQRFSCHAIYPAIFCQLSTRFTVTFCKYLHHPSDVISLFQCHALPCCAGIALRDSTGFPAPARLIEPLNAAQALVSRPHHLANRPCRCYHFHQFARPITQLLLRVCAVVAVALSLSNGAS